MLNLKNKFKQKCEISLAQQDNLAMNLKNL